jgi:hypothetical protein
VNATTWKINRTGGQAVDNANFLPSGNQSISGATLSSASGTDLVFAKTDNGITTTSPVQYYSTTTLSGYILGTAPDLRIDNQGPDASTLQLRVQRLYEETPTNATSGIEVSRSTKLFYSGGSDPGPGVGTDPASFQATLKFGIPTQTVTKGRGDSLNDLPAGTYPITVEKLVIKDRLGNTTEVTTGLPSLSFRTTPLATISVSSAPATATAGVGYPFSLSSYTPGDFPVVALALKQGGNRYLLQSLSPGPNTWTAFKLGDGPSAAMNLAVVAIDLHGNVQELDLNVTVSAASGADQQAPAVNSLTASGALQAGNALSSAILRARASERPSHSTNAVKEFRFFRQHSNAGQYFVLVSIVSPVDPGFTGGSSEDRADSVSIDGSTYPNPGTFGTAVLVKDGVHNAALGTGTLTVNP